MKILDVKQGGVDWFNARLGRPTASMFSTIVTPGGKRTENEARETYRAELCQERLTGNVTDHGISDKYAVERGKDLEPRARAFYTLETKRDVRQVGFCQDDAGRWGYSPDGLCEDRTIEIKCPVGAKMLKKLLAAPQDAAKEYVVQCQGGLFVTGFAACDLVLFTDVAGVPNRIITLARDEKMMQAFAVELPFFCDELDRDEKLIRAMGGGVDIGTGLVDSSSFFGLDK